MRVLRQNADGEQRTTFLELFFDLVFVFAITEVSHYLVENLTIGGAAQALFFLLVVWWAWIYTTWMTNWFDPDSVPVRVVLLAGMLAGMIMTIALPRAFGGNALVFIAGYVGLQVLRNAFIVLVTRPNVPLHRAFRRILAWSSWVGVIWLVGALFDGPALVAIWTVALLLDYAGPFAGYWTPGLGRTRMTDWELEYAHFAERFQLFVIIALGESVVLAGATAARLPLTAGRWAAVVCAFALAAALWWLYFDEAANRSNSLFGAELENRGGIGRDAYTYLHIPIVGGIIVSAVGVEFVIAHPLEALSSGELIALAAGPVLFLLGHLAFRLRMSRTLARRRIAAAALVIFVVFAAGRAPSLLVMALVVAIFVVLAASETATRVRPLAGKRGW